jgi:hypothetical protein
MLNVADVQQDPVVLMGFAGLWSGPWVRCNLILAACFPSLSLSHDHDTHIFLSPMCCFSSRLDSNLIVAREQPIPRPRVKWRVVAALFGTTVAHRLTLGRFVVSRSGNESTIHRWIDHQKVVLVEEMSTKDAGGRNSMSPRSAAVHFNDQALVAMIT